MWHSNNRVAWWAAVLMVSQLCCDTAKSFSTDIPCPTEFIICAADDECGECLAFLEELTELNYNGQCEDLYSEVCTVVGQGGCNTNNPQLVDLAQCVAQDEFGCSGFTTCEDFVTDLTPAPLPVGVTSAPAITTAPTPAPVAASVAPSASVAPVVPTITLAPAASVAPSTATDRDITIGSIAPTGAPTTAATEVDETETDAAGNGAGGRFGGGSAVAVSSAVALAAGALAWCASAGVL